VAADDREVLERVDACYRWAREMGDPLIGFYAEAMPGSDQYLGRQGNTVEICEVADMVLLALYLTRAGIGDYWDDVDRWVRNMYAEGQIRSAGFLDRLPDGYFNPAPRGNRYQDTRDVAERSIGSFLGWMRANDGLKVEASDGGVRLSDHSIMHCCTANGARTLYYVWDSIVTAGPGVVRVNLLLNRVSPELDVLSFLPAEGRVVLRIKSRANVEVRLPEWCDPGTVRAELGDEDIKTSVDGQFIGVAGLERGDRLTLNFPVPERVIHRVIGEMPYKLVLRGSNVVSIDPKGSALPLFESVAGEGVVRKTRFLPVIRDIIW
jgi:DUF1680 family protein